MLDVVAAAGIGVAADAILAGGPGAHGDAAGHRVQVDSGVGHAGRRRALFVGSGLVMANEAIDVAGIVEIEAGVFVTQAGVALGTAPLVGGDSDAEIVQEIVLAVDAALHAFDLAGLAFPLEVTHLERGLALLLVAHEAGFRSLVKHRVEVDFVHVHLVRRCVFEELFRGRQVGTLQRAGPATPGQNHWRQY